MERRGKPDDHYQYGMVVVSKPTNTDSTQTTTKMTVRRQVAKAFWHLTKNLALHKNFLLRHHSPAFWSFGATRAVVRFFAAAAFLLWGHFPGPLTRPLL